MMQYAMDDACLRFCTCLVWTCNFLFSDTIHTSTFKITTILNHTGCIYSAWANFQSVFLTLNKDKTSRGGYEWLDRHKEMRW